MRKKILPFVTTYHPALQNLKNILMSKWHLIQDQPLLREIYTSLPSFHMKEQNRWEMSSLEQNYKVTYHTVTSLSVLFGLSPSTSQSTPCWNWNRKSRFNALSACGWQLYPQGSLGATLIGPSAPTRFWVGKIGANQVWKVLRPAPYEIFWKSISTVATRHRLSCEKVNLHNPWLVRRAWDTCEETC